MGRAPVKATMVQLAPKWAGLAFQCGQATLVAASYVDNLFSVGKTLADAISIQEDWAKALDADWDLKIGDDSRSCLQPALDHKDAPPRLTGLYWHCLS